MRLRYVSANEDKFREIQAALPAGCVVWLRTHKQEILSLDPRAVLEAKAREVYRGFSGAFFIDHMALYLAQFKDKLPGTVTSPLLEVLGLEGFCNWITGTRSGVAVCYGLYCDGSKFLHFDARVSGKVADRPRGRLGFGWDKIFIPEGSDKTFGEMKLQRKVEQSPRTAVCRKIYEIWREQNEVK